MTPQELFDAYKSGKKIEVNFSKEQWEEWDGMGYHKTWKFRIKEEPRLVRHWPAIVKYEGGHYIMSTKLFTSEEDARKTFKHARFIRLATERLSILLPIVV